MSQKIFVVEQEFFKTCSCDSDKFQFKFFRRVRSLTALGDVLASATGGWHPDDEVLHWYRAYAKAEAQLEREQLEAQLEREQLEQIRERLELVVCTEPDQFKAEEEERKRQQEIEDAPRRELARLAEEAAREKGEQLLKQIRERAQQKAKVPAA